MASLIDDSGTTRFEGTITGAGGTPAGNDGEIQYNDNGAFGATADFTIDSPPGQTTLGLESGINGTAAVTALGAGSQLTLQAADGAAASIGGEVTIESGGSAGGNGGDLTIQAGSDSAAGTGGNIGIHSGGSAADDGGDITIRPHPAGAAGGVGGRVTIHGGTGTGGGNGGGVIVQAGAPGGGVSMWSAGVAHTIDIDDTGIYVGGKLGLFGSNPVVQPSPIADATDPASTMARLNDLLAAARLVGLIDT